MAKLKATLFEHKGIKREIDVGLNHISSNKLVATLLPDLFGQGGLLNNHSTEKVSIRRFLENVNPDVAQNVIKAKSRLEFL